MNGEDNIIRFRLKPEEIKILERAMEIANKALRDKGVPEFTLPMFARECALFGCWEYMKRKRFTDRKKYAP